MRRFAAGRGIGLPISALRCRAAVALEAWWLALIPMSGLDATVQAVQHILDGDQPFTVYFSIRDQAALAADLARGSCATRPPTGWTPRSIPVPGACRQSSSRPAGNLVNLVVQAAGITAIARGLVFVGRIILASRLRSVSAGAGGGPLLLHAIAAAVIGGTSLFGGRGHIRSAVLGALVIASIDNGLGLVGFGSGEKFVITGLVLLGAASVDSLVRRQGGR